jgi:hypothetical protein
MPILILIPSTETNIWKSITSSSGTFLLDVTGKTKFFYWIVMDLFFVLVFVFVGFVVQFSFLTLSKTCKKHVQQQLSKTCKIQSIIVSTQLLLDRFQSKHTP